MSINSYFTQYYGNLISYLTSYDVVTYIRLAAIVGGYVLARRIAVKYLANKQLERQIANDKVSQEKKRKEALIQKPIEPTTEAWGWGKKTRRRVKHQQAALEDQMLNQEVYDDKEDKDIEEFLLKD